ncbi:hypothetical protein SSX86_025414 [Deinandra increscens subsp. villosa]|uniref:DUF7135 domain-containing protein n=1 Tax=Deinandra increscens subsp. villosa TaxID=3103831 RepID=A0AAP0CE64_9ASTR
MGAAESRQDLVISDSESEEEEQFSDEEEEDYEQFSDDEIEALKLKNAVKLYIHIGGNTAQSKWVVADKLTWFCFVKTMTNEEEDHDNEEEEVERLYWVLKVGSKVRSPVDQQLRLRPYMEQLRIDFVSNEVYALKFFSIEDFKGFIEQCEKCLFENTYGFERIDEHKAKVFGKDFVAMANPEAADDDSMWADAEDSLSKTAGFKTPREEFEDAAKRGSIKSLSAISWDEWCCFRN